MAKHSPAPELAEEQKQLAEAMSRLWHLVWDVEKLRDVKAIDVDYRGNKKQWQHGSLLRDLERICM